MTRAAARLHLAQPALLQAIARLESQAGVTLLERHARGVAQTAAGAAPLVKARATLAAAEEVDTAAKAWSRAHAGELSIGFLPLTLIIVETLLDEFRRRHPETRVTTRELNFASQLRELRADPIDAEIVAPIPDAPDLTVELLHASPRVVLMSPTHRLAIRTTLTFADIAAETQPGGHPDIPQEWLDYNWMTAERGRRPPLTNETPLTPEECVPLLARGDVITISPEFVARTLLVHGLIAVPITDAAPFTVGLACRTGDDRPAVRWLIEHARERAQRTCSRNPRIRTRARARSHSVRPGARPPPHTGHQRSSS